MGDYLEHLNNKYGQGGSNTTSAPTEKTTSSSTGSSYLDHLNSKYGSNTPVTSVSTSTEEIIPSVTNPTPNAETSLESPNFSDEDIIAKYESLPNTNFFARILPSRKEAYKQKQELYPAYKEAKMREVGKLVEDLGITEGDLALGDGQIMGVSVGGDSLAKYNLTDAQRKDVLEYANDYFKQIGDAAIKEMSGKNTASKIGMTALTYATNPIESMADTLSAGADYLLGHPVSKRSIDITQNVRDTVSEDMSGAGKFAYGTVNSIADMLVALAVGKGTGFKPGTIMGTEKASSTMRGAAERGLTPNQIVAEGIASGLTTAITEGKVFEELGKSLTKNLESAATEQIGKQLIKEMARGFALEGSQEVAEGTLDLIADQIIAGAFSKENKTELNTAYKRYINEGGLSEDEAKGKVLVDTLLSGVMDFLGGGIAGGVLGGAGVSLGATGDRVNNDIDNLNFGNLTEENADTQSQIEDFEKRKAQRDMERRLAEEQSANEIPNLSELLAQAEQIPNANADTVAENTDARDKVERLFSLNEQLQEAQNRLSQIEKDANTVTEEDLPSMDDIEDDGFIPFFDPNATKNESNPVTNPTLEQLLTDEQKAERNALTNEVTRLQNEIANLTTELGGGADYRWNPKAFDRRRNTKANSTGDVPTLSKNTSRRNDVMAEDIGIGKKATDVVTELPDGTLSLEAEIPLEPQGNEYISQTAANSIANGLLADDIPSAAQFTERMDEGAFNQTRISEDESVKEARELLSTQDGRNAVNGVLNSNAEITGVYVDATMQMLEEARVRAKETGNYTEFNKLAKLISDKMHNVGQSLQALAKYTRSATGSIMQTQKLRDAYTENYYKKNSNKPKKEKCGKLATALKKMGYDGSMDVEKGSITHEQMVERVKNTMSEEYASITDGFGDADYEYLARLIEGNIGTNELTQRIEERIATDSWGLSDAEIQKINELFDEAEAVGINSRKASELLQQAYSIEAQHLGEKTFMDKWNAWRYFAMLGNPRTHFRNILGNMLFGSVTDVKDSVVALIENQYAKSHPDYQRTTSLVSKATDPELFKAAETDFEQNGFAPATEGSKYDMRTEIEKARSDGWLLDKNSDFLEMEDNAAIKRKYVKSLASYIKANGMNADVLTSTDKADIEFCKKAREYAIAQAQEATFHEENRFASLLNEFSRSARQKGGALGFGAEVLIESTVPFKKTPANILKSGVEYSPLGFGKALIDAKSGKEVNTVINDMAKGMTGTSIMVLGMLLSSLGYIRGGNDDDESKAMGDQEYAVQLPSGTYTIDWAAPAALPLFVGVEIQKAIEGDNNLIDATSSILEPMIEMSMLQGIKNTMKSLAYGMQNSDNTEVANALATFGTSYITQGIPTVAGQVARAIDPYRRSTYSDQQGLLGSLDYQKEKAVNKIPGLSMTNEAYIDEWGNKQENTGGNFLGRLAYNMISPGYYQSNVRNELETEIERLGDLEGQDKSLLPKAPNKNYDGERIDEKTYEQLSISAGQHTTDALTSLFNSEGYASLSDKDKVGVVGTMESFCQALAKSEHLGYNIEESNSYKKAYRVYKESGMDGLAKYYTTKEGLSTLTQGSTKQVDVIPALAQMNMTDAERGEYLASSLSSINQDAQPFVDKGDYESLYQYYFINAMANTDGKNGTTNAELVAYLKSSGMPMDERLYWYKIFNPTVKDEKIPSLW